MEMRKLPEKQINYKLPQQQMKFTVLLLYFIVGCMAKNVFNLDKFRTGLESEKHEKRDPKNVVNLDNFKIGVPEKRDAKNVVDTSKFKNFKRDAKNVVNLDHFKIGVPNSGKRDAKNVIDLSKFKIGKRDAKNVVKPFKMHGDDKNIVFDALKSRISRRDQQVMIKDDSDATLLQSILPQFKDISIFAGYIRDNEEINAKTESISESMLVIAPTDNSIMTKLSGYKPWEFPKQLDEGNEDEIISSNLNYFISNHVVFDFSDFQIKENEISVKLLSGKEIKIVGESNQIYIVSDGVKINVGVSKQVDNGYIFIIDDVLIKPQV